MKELAKQNFNAKILREKKDNIVKMRVMYQIVGNLIREKKKIVIQNGT